MLAWKMISMVNRQSVRICGHLYLGPSCDHNYFSTCKMHLFPPKRFTVQVQVIFGQTSVDPVHISGAPYLWSSILLCDSLFHKIRPQEPLQITKTSVFFLVFISPCSLLKSSPSQKTGSIMGSSQVFPVSRGSSSCNVSCLLCVQCTALNKKPDTPGDKLIWMENKIGNWNRPRVIKITES